MVQWYKSQNIQQYASKDFRDYNANIYKIVALKRSFQYLLFWGKTEANAIFSETMNSSFSFKLKAEV